VKNTADVTGGKPIAVLLQSISGVSAINPKKERDAILLFYPGHHTRPIDDKKRINVIYL
jgi:hypothetical protein